MGFGDSPGRRRKPLAAHPLRKGRTSDRQPGAAENFLLPIQQQIVGELGQLARTDFFQTLFMRHK
ncbi:hypothetical protein ALQ59_200112 [Pseudomonas syringae pv. apii]|nr:hypothetical protein ALQ59_200112 [Pseudomonas syringae pv. apii]RMN56184.1 hypothetical protein ALQ58_200345 [Pseudomonas syringae pv. apii]